jgi:RimJ/RimL family protein N-acetyltransferase
VAGQAAFVSIVLRDAGVTLRPFERGDFDVLWREETSDRGEFDTPWAADDDTAKARVRARVDQSGTWREGRVLDLAIVVEGSVVGDIQARRDVAYAPPGIYDLGIGLFADRRGTGVGTTAIRLLTAFLFDEEQAVRVTLSADLDNTAMRRVAEKAGFTQEGVMRGFWAVPGAAARDYALYARTRADHEAG